MLRLLGFGVPASGLGVGALRVNCNRRVWGLSVRGLGFRPGYWVSGFIITKPGPNLKHVIEVWIYSCAVVTKFLPDKIKVTCGGLAFGFHCPRGSSLCVKEMKHHKGLFKLWRF